MTYATPHTPLDYAERNALGDALSDMHGAAFVACVRLRALGSSRAATDALMRDVMARVVERAYETKAAK